MWLLKFRFLRLLTLACVVLGITIALKGCVWNRDTLRPFKVGLNTWPGYQVALYAQATGLFHEHNLEVDFVRFNNQQDNIRATMRGAQDASFVPLSEVMQVDRTKETPVFVLVVDVSSGSDGIAARPEITSVKDLKGKKVSAKFSTVSHLILLEALKAHQMEAKEVDIVDVSNEQGAELLKTGQITGAVLWEPILADTAKMVNGTIIHSTADVDSLVIDGLSTRSSILKTKQSELVDFLEVWFEVMDALEADPQSVFAVVAKQLGIPPETFAEDYAGLKKGDVALNRRMFTEGRLPQAYQETRQLLLSDPRHGRIIRDDVAINPEIFNKAIEKRSFQSPDTP